MSNSLLDVSQPIEVALSSSPTASITSNHVTFQIAIDKLAEYDNNDQLVQVHISLSRSMRRYLLSEYLGNKFARN